MLLKLKVNETSKSGGSLELCDLIFVYIFLWILIYRFCCVIKSKVPDFPQALVPSHGVKGLERTKAGRGSQTKNAEKTSGRKVPP